MSGVMADPLSDAVDRFREVSTYQVTVRSVAADGERQVIRYFYRKPGWVRMEFVQPHRAPLKTGLASE
jgi:outer membrane lipoprotein-sorting protein